MRIAQAGGEDGKYTELYGVENIKGYKWYTVLGKN